MFKCSTLSQYFQAKPAFFSRFFHVLPAEARLSAQNLSFCGENRREGLRPAPTVFQANHSGMGPAGGASPSPTARNAEQWEGRAAPIYFPGRPPGDAAEARDAQRLPPPHRASSFFIPASRPSTVRGNMGNTRAMAS